MNIERIYKTFKKSITYILLLGMAIVVASTTIELLYILFTDLIEPPGFLLGISELYSLFGMFLMVIIAMELMSSVYVTLKDDRLHLEVMFLVAITAVTRKILVIDPSTMDPMFLIGIGILVAALSWGYVHTKELNSDSSESDSG